MKVDKIVPILYFIFRNNWWRVCRKITADCANADGEPGLVNKYFGQSANAFFVGPFFDWLKKFFFIQIFNVWQNYVLLKVVQKY